MKFLSTLWAALLSLALFIAGAFVAVTGSRGHAGPAPTNQATLQLAQLGRSVLHFARFLSALIVAAVHDVLVLARIPLAPVALHVDAWTKISDLWVPEILVEGMKEEVVERTAFIDSGVVATSPTVTAAASGPGTAIQIPFIVTPNHDDEIQKQDTAPSMNKLGSGLQIAAISNRVSTLGHTALAGQVSGIKPGGDLLRVLLDVVQGLRKRQRNRYVLAQLQGLFHTVSAPAANTGAFKALRLDQFLEDGAIPLAANLVDSEMLLDAIALAGENSQYFTGGAIHMHSDIANALNKQDQIDTIRNSEGRIVYQSWKGLTVVISDKLIRVGGTSGNVYTTFICGLGSIAMGDKPQMVGGIGNPVIDVASLNINADVTKNNAGIYDRTRFICHPQGAKWTGTPADTDGGPTNAELATYGNWALGANDAQNVRIVCVRTNG